MRTQPTSKTFGRFARFAVIVIAGASVLGIAASPAEANVTVQGQTGSTHVACSRSTHEITATAWMWTTTGRPTYAAAYIYSYATRSGHWTQYFATDRLGSGWASTTVPAGAYAVYMQYLWYTGPTTYVIGGEWITSYQQQPYYTNYSSYCSA